MMVPSPVKNRKKQKENAENELKREIERNMNIVQNNLKKVQDELLEDAKSFEEAITANDENIAITRMILINFFIFT